MWHGLPAREITAKMAVPPIKQLRLNTYNIDYKCFIENDISQFVILNEVKNLLPATIHNPCSQAGCFAFGSA